MNVLLVEDEPAVADFVGRGLRAENHFVAVGKSRRAGGSPGASPDDGYTHRCVGLARLRITEPL